MKTIDFTHVVSMTLNSQNVKRISRGGVTLWQKSVAPSYTPIEPIDTEQFPATLTGYTYEELHGDATGKSSTYVGSVYAKPWIAQPARKLGRAYSEIGNSVSSFDDYEYGKLAIGYSSDSTATGTRALNVWISPTAVTALQGNALIEAANAHILYELYESDGSVWKAVVRNTDGITGYWNEATDEFLPVQGGIPY